MSVWSKDTESGMRLVVFQRKPPKDCRFRLIVSDQDMQRRITRVAKNFGFPVKTSANRLFQYVHVQDFDDIIAIRMMGERIAMIEEFVEGDDPPLLPNWKIS